MDSPRIGGPKDAFIIPVWLPSAWKKRERGMLPKLQSCLGIENCDRNGLGWGVQAFLKGNLAAFGDPVSSLTKSVKNRKEGSACYLPASVPHFLCWVNSRGKLSVHVESGPVILMSLTD